MEPTAHVNIVREARLPMRWKMWAAFGAFAAVYAFVLWDAGQSKALTPTIRPVVTRMVRLNHPLLRPVGPSASKRRLWQAESIQLSRTFIPGSPFIAQDRDTFRHILAAGGEPSMVLNYVSVQAKIVLGPLSLASFQVTEGNNFNQNLTAESGFVFLRRVHGHWRVVTYWEYYTMRNQPG